tara:strand:+ start:462 stop:824 length:363 start_codon:yes stop_codon:yes gene_type:complete
MPNEHGYPHKPFRANHVDIRTMQIFDPVVIGSKTTTAGNDWELMSATGGTLENGVRIKNTSANALYVKAFVNGMTAGATGAGVGGGYMLTESEEVFLEVRQLSDIFVTGVLGASCGFIAS